MADSGPGATSTVTGERRIHVGDVQVNGDQIVLPCESKVVASYNWSTTSTTGHPHIIAPGTARVYVSPSSKRGDSRANAPGAPLLYVPPRARGFKLQKDYGVPVVDENGSMMHPFNAHLPLFRSLEVCSPEFDFGTVDIVTDRNNLRKLLRFCDSPDSSPPTYFSEDQRNEPFKFFVHGIGQGRKDGATLVFTRAATDREDSFHGYGKNYENKLTEKDPSAPFDTGRFSVIAKMRLDGVTLLVRSKVDARERLATSTSTVPASKSPSASTRKIEDNLSEHLGSLLVSSGGKAARKTGTLASSEKETSSADLGDVSGSSGLICTSSGDLLGDEHHLLELKSKNENFAHQINWKDFNWQMVLGGAQKLVLGLHRWGTFDRLQHLPIQEVKARAEQDGSSSMVYLANTLREVIKAAHCLMAMHTSSCSDMDENKLRPALVVEGSATTARGDGTLRVRLAVPEDGAVAP